MRFVAGRGAVAKRLVRGAAVAERHRGNADRGRRGEETGSTVADSHQEDAARREMLRGRAPSGKCWPRHRCEAPCERRRRGEETGSAVAKRHREDAARREMRQGESSGRRCPQGDALRIRIGKTLMTGSCIRERHRAAASGSHTAAKGRWQGSSSGV